jgi:hypothetical protein
MVSSIGYLADNSAARAGFGEPGRRRFDLSNTLRQPAFQRKEPIMADDTSKTGKPDRDRINSSEDYEVRDWAKKFGVSEDALRAAVKKAGPMAKDVAKSLGKSL